MTYAARQTRSPIKVDVVVKSGLWTTGDDVKPLLRRAVGAAAAILAPRRAQLTIVLSDDSAIRLLNQTWRGIDKPTNVLSFPAGGSGAGGGGGEPPLLGDVVLAHETIAREASEQRKPFAHHLAHLAVHGLLHLLGYDHEEDEAAETMEQVERDILARLAIADPYRHPTPA